MSPRHLLRAMQPLRSSIVPQTSLLSAQGPAMIQYSRPTPSPRQYSAPTEEPFLGNQEQQNSTPQPSTAPPSLRRFPYKTKKGDVISVNKMDRCVQVNYHHKMTDRHLRKDFPKIDRFKVSDPNNSLRFGDVIEFTSGERTGRTVRHTVERIITPFGEAIEDRPPVLSREEREAAYEAKRQAKTMRRAERKAKRMAEGVIEPADVRGHAQDHIGRIRRLVLERTETAGAA